MDYLVSLAASPPAWLALAALISMEIVLGVDNLVFIAILSNSLPKAQRSSAIRIGIGLSLVFRILLLSSLAALEHLTAPAIDIITYNIHLTFSWRDLILIGGGLFLLYKAVKELIASIKPSPLSPAVKPNAGGFAWAILQILLLDLVFSIDSIITAVGMTEHIPIMILSVAAAVAAMLLAADPLANFIHKNPRIVILALGFLLLIGAALISEGFAMPLPKSYIYTAMAFSSGIELLNILRNRFDSQTAATAHEK